MNTRSWIQRLCFQTRSLVIHDARPPKDPDTGLNTGWGIIYLQCSAHILGIQLDTFYTYLSLCTQIGIQNTSITPRRFSQPALYLLSSLVNLSFACFPTW